MKAGIFRKCVRAPLMTPSKVAAASASTEATGHGKPNFIRSAAMTPVIAMLAPVERSMPPVSSTKDCPSARNMMTAPLTRSMKLLLTVRNDGEMRLRPSATTTRTAKIPLSSGTRRRRAAAFPASPARSDMLDSRSEGSWRRSCELAGARRPVAIGSSRGKGRLQRARVGLRPDLKPGAQAAATAWVEVFSSAAAACTAAPAAAVSAVGEIQTGLPARSASACREARERAAPPVRMSRPSLLTP